MPEMSLDIRKIYSLTEFMRNYKAHLSSLKETKTPEVLTIKGRAEFVVLDADSYQSLLDRIHNAEEASSIRSVFAKSRLKHTPLPEEEIARRHGVIDELVAETEKLDLYE